MRSNSETSDTHVTKKEHAVIYNICNNREHGVIHKDFKDFEINSVFFFAIFYIKFVQNFIDSMFSILLQSSITLTY